jgi:hypothetical protein
LYERGVPQATDGIWELEAPNYHYQSLSAVRWRTKAQRTGTCPRYHVTLGSRLWLAPWFHDFKSLCFLLITCICHIKKNDRIQLSYLGDYILVKLSHKEHGVPFIKLMRPFKA